METAKDKEGYWAIPVQWIHTSVIYIKAKSPIDAIIKFYDNRDFIALPEDYHYDRESFKISYPDPEIIKNGTELMKNFDWPHFDRDSYDFEESKR